MEWGDQTIPNQDDAQIILQVESQNSPLDRVYVQAQLFVTQDQEYIGQ
jgi:hypothetical protein